MVRGLLPGGGTNKVLVELTHGIVSVRSADLQQPSVDGPLVDSIPVGGGSFHLLHVRLLHVREEELLFKKLVSQRSRSGIISIASLWQWGKRVEELRLQGVGLGDLRPHMVPDAGRHTTAEHLVQLPEFCGVLSVRSPLLAPRAQRDRSSSLLGLQLHEFLPVVPPGSPLLALAAVQVRDALEHLLHVAEVCLALGCRLLALDRVEVRIIASL
mmetsp:Transcript_2841/g.6438  ORF Transcript_2841/g.6438 Transcript_2841/m.6438 type:complete len:213 (+) Transcript_2841:588-1226(+)